MSHKQRIHTILENVEFTGSVKYGASMVKGEDTVVPQSKATAAPAALTHESLYSQVRCEEITVTAGTLTATDNGDATGGFVAQELFTMPSAHCLILGAALDLNVTAVSASIAAASVLSIGVGTAATAVADLSVDGADIDLIAANSMTLIAGAKRTFIVSGTAMIQLDGTAAKKYYLNIGIPDANISANGTLTANILFRLYYIDLTAGA